MSPSQLVAVMPKIYTLGFVFFMLIPGVFTSSTNAQSPGLKFHWDEGLRVEDQQHRYQGKFGGRMMYDMAWFDQDARLDDMHGKMGQLSEFRRVRAFHSGRFQNVKYKVQFEFSNEQVEIADLYVEVGNIPVVGNVRVGHFKEPFMLNALTSSKYITFMERGLPMMFSSGRNVGIMLHDHIGDSKYYWQLSALRNGMRDDNNERIGGHHFIARIAGVVLEYQESRQLLHLGMAIKQSRSLDNAYELTSRPESNLSPKYIATGILDDARSFTSSSFEASAIMGSMSLQGEFVQSFVHAMPESIRDQSNTFSSWYGQASFMITGEQRNFKDSSKGFGRVRPARNAGRNGLGAWELAIRVSAANLNDDLVYGGELRDMTLGVNWYLNPQARITANYVISKHMDMGTARIFQTRMQLEF